MANFLKIISQPKCQYASIGTKVEFVIEASGINLTFQWYNQDGLAIPEASGSVLSIAPLRNEHFGFYRVRVRDYFGSHVLSDWIELANASFPCHDPPKFVIEPKPVSANVGDFDNLFCHATGANLQYQWYDERGMMIPGATDKYLLFTPLKENDFGFYKCAVLDIFGREDFSNWIQVTDKAAVMKDIC